MLHLEEQRLQARRQRLSGERQRDAAVSAHEQRRPDPLFQAPDLHADGGGGDTELARRGGETQVARGGIEAAQRIQGQVSHGSSHHTDSNESLSNKF